jgi:hypothetical protein
MNLGVLAGSHVCWSLLAVALVWRVAEEVPMVGSQRGGKRLAPEATALVILWCLPTLLPACRTVERACGKR